MHQALDSYLPGAASRFATEETYDWFYWDGVSLDSITFVSPGPVLC
jgi:hypothetical protein